MKNPYSLVRGLSSTQIAIVIWAIAGIILTRKPTPTVITTTTTTTTPITAGPLVFYTWWASTGKVALNHLIPIFEQQTGITVEPYLVPIAAGNNAKYAILALVEAGKPPASFQVHYGPEMISYVEAAPNGVNSFVNMTQYAIQWGLLKNAVYEVLQAGAFNGTLLSVPVTVHRGSLLFINAQLLREYNLPFPYNFSTLVYDTIQLAEHGIYPWMIPGGDGTNSTYGKTYSYP